MTLYPEHPMADAVEGFPRINSKPAYQPIEWNCDEDDQPRGAGTRLT